VSKISSNELRELASNLGKVMAPSQYGPYTRAFRAAAETIDAQLERIDELECPPGTWAEKERLGGIPCLDGRRVSVAQIMSEIAQGHNIREIADNYALDVDQLTRIFKGFSAALSMKAACIDAPKNVMDKIKPSRSASQYPED
jgi:uncharacterized protein (DUF433 family)